MSQETAVHVENVTKNYGSFCAVDQVSFDVSYGEIFAMLGPNGAGKSTTIRMMLDILKPDSGTIRLFGAPITAEAKDRIGYLPEERGLYSDVKVVEMMTYLGTLKGMSSKQAHDKAMQLLERLELADRAEKKSKELSKGMQQKVQFAVTVMHEPELIIVDEPFSGLDPLNTLVIKDLILELKAAGTAIIMSTHQMHQIEEMADRLFMISRGREALYGPVDEVRSRYAPHAVIVEGTGDYSTLPGIERVEADRNQRKASLLYMAPDVVPNDVLASIAAAPEVSVDRFERAVPSLNDIFIQVAGESAYEDQRVEASMEESTRSEAVNA